MRTLEQQSSSVFFALFFGILKAALLAVIIIVCALVAGQSRVAPVSVHLLTAYAMEYAANTFKPYRHLFPQPYPPILNIP